MTKETSEAKTTEKAPTENAGEDKSCNDSCGKGASCCRPHAALYIAVVALLLAGYAAFAAGSANNTATEQHLQTLDAQVADINTRIEALGKDIQSNRESLIQTKLKRALTSIQEIGGMATEETKSTIAEVEKMLHALTSSSAAPESETVAEPEAAPESAPATEAEATAVEAQPEAAPAAVEPAPAPAEESAPTEETVTEPAAETPAAESATPEAPASEAEAPTEPQAF